MAGQGAAARSSPYFDRRWYHHASDERRFWYITFIKSHALSHLPSKFYDFANNMTGHMVGSFTGFFSQDASTTYEMFKNAISTCA